MNRSAYTSVFSLWLGLAVAAAQPADTTNYFPLEVGNSWTYYSVGHPPSAPPDTAIGLPQEIVHTWSINDTLYYLAPHEDSLTDTLRDDGIGRVWARYRGRDVLLYDFTLEDGEKYLFQLSEFVADTFEVTVDRNVTVDVAAGHFEKCIRLTFDIPLAVDDERSFVFAPTIGIVSGYDGHGVDWNLYEAVVGGRVISRPKSYFPLGIGNSWTYYHVRERYNAPPDTGVGLPIEIGGALSVDDTLYYLVPHPESLADTLREDGEGRIWARVLNKDVLLYDFTMAESAMYLFDRTDWSDDTYEVRVERNVTVDVVAGHFENGVRFTFDIPEAVDDERSFTFAPGVGPVVSSHWGERTYLYEAVVGGNVISSSEHDAPGLPQGGVAYPNPFRESTMVLLPNNARGTAGATVYDVLGRTVAKLTTTECSIDGCAFRWDGGDAANGLFFVVPDVGRRHAVSVVLSR